MRILELTLWAANLDELRRFYTAVLGLDEFQPEQPGLLAVTAGHTTLYFHEAPRGWQGQYHFAFGVPPDRFETALRWQRERGGTIASSDGKTSFHHTAWNADAVYFRDPQGNILELIAHLDLDEDFEGTENRAGIDTFLPPDTDRPFNASEIIGITEIGIGTDSVLETVAELQIRMPGIPIYDGKGSDQFTTVGDIYGLLIVARRGRIWFPNTGVPADHLPLDILLELAQGQRYRLSAPPFPISIRPE